MYYNILLCTYNNLATFSEASAYSKTTSSVQFNSSGTQFWKSLKQKFGGSSKDQSEMPGMYYETVIK